MTGRAPSVAIVRAGDPEAAAGGDDRAAIATNETTGVVESWFAKEALLTGDGIEVEIVALAEDASPATIAAAARAAEARADAVLVERGPDAAPTVHGLTLDVDSARDPLMVEATLRTFAAAELTTGTSYDDASYLDDVANLNFAGKAVTALSLIHI